MHFSGLKLRAKQFLSWIAKRIGITFLTRKGTIEYLMPYQRGYHPANQLPLPEIPNSANQSEIIFKAKTAVAFPSYSWAYNSEGHKTTLLRCGNILTNGQVLCPDYDNQFLLKDQFNGGKRRPYNVNTLVAPFGQYVDGIAYGGYYDYMFLIAAKLCRIEQDLLNFSFAESFISYPLFNTSYEREFLYYLGFSPDHILDSRQYSIQASECLLGSSGHWFYPNAVDVSSLRQRFLPLIQPQSANRERIYISRSGRRRISNEEALIDLLQAYDFTIVEDKPRPLAEQLSLYNNASFIIGPHGASFSNIVWCQPGTHLFELFSPNYAPDHFLYLAQLMGLTYSAYWKGKKNDKSAWPKTVSEDIILSISDIEQSLNKHFENQHQKTSL